MEETRDLVMEILAQWRFRTTVEKDSGIAFRYQMNYVICMLDDTDSAFITLLLPLSYDMEQNNTENILKVCNNVNSKKKQAKMYISDDNTIVISAEFFYGVKEDLPQLLQRALDALISAKLFFLEQVFP